VIVLSLAAGFSGLRAQDAIGHLRDALLLGLGELIERSIRFCSTGVGPRLPGPFLCSPGSSSTLTPKSCAKVGSIETAGRARG